jgi:uncharacterized membrane protein YfcA
MTAILALVLLVAFLFPMLGMGGGQVYTPAFYWLGLDLRTQAVPLALWLSFARQSAAAVSYWRHGLIQFRTALPIIVGLVCCAPVGALVSHRTSDKVILFLFATMTVVALRQTLTGRRAGDGSSPRRASVFVAPAGGATIGLLAGMVGRGGGSLVVPMLLLLGLDPKRAAATSSFAICFSSLSGFLGHLAIAGPALPAPWLAVLTAAAVAAAFAGSRYMARRLRSRTVRRLFAVALGGVAAKLYWDVFAS